MKKSCVDFEKCALLAVAEASGKIRKYVDIFPKKGKFLTSDV